MCFTRKNLAEKSIPLLITQAALHMAQQFADEQPTPEKKQQVYLNTLAVYLVNDYMEIMQIPTDLKASDSWNRAMRLYANVADLKLTALGHLECRPMRGTMSYIPPEVPDHRIGVVVVEIDLEHQAATMLGFAKTVKPGSLPLNELQTVDDLLEYLEQLERHLDEVNLSQWLQQIFAAGWQSTQEILAPIVPATAFRYFSGVTRAKLVDLGIHLPDQSVALVVTLTPSSEVEIQIRLQVHPTGEQIYLPENLTVKVLDAAAEPVMSAAAKTTNTHITLKFSVQLGERFSVSLELGDTNITEKFVV